MRGFQYIFYLSVLLIIGCNSKKDLKQEENIFQFTSNDSLNLGIATEFLQHDDQYHLFYQCKAKDGKKFWGHSVSLDQLTWDPLSLLEIDGNGSVFYDEDNSLLLNAEKPAMIAIYVTNTSKYAQSISLSYSLDDGLSWNEYNNNPIAINDGTFPFKDVKVFWHDESQRWIMLALVGYKVQFYASFNLIDWEYVSEYGEKIYEQKGNWTNLEFVPVNEQKTDETKWVLFITGDKGSPNTETGTRYFVGDFDGYNFVAHKDQGQWLDYGTDTFLGVGALVYDGEKERTVLYTCINQNKTIYNTPKYISVIKKYNKYYLLSSPIIESERTLKKVANENEFEGIANVDIDFDLPIEIEVEFGVNNKKYLDFAEVFGVILTNDKKEQLTIGYHNMKRYFFIDFGAENSEQKMYYAPFIIDTTQLDVKILITRSKIELIAANGFVIMTKSYASNESFDQLKLFSEKGKIKINNCVVNKF